MTPNEIQMLIVGIVLGWTVANVLHAWVAGRDATRGATEAEAALKRAVGDRYLTSLWQYQREHRRPGEPRPAELLEASLRDFELKLYDGLGRVEDAARRDGLL